MRKHSLETSLLLALLIILLFAVYGCGGTRKTDTARTETKTDNINIENSYSTGSKIVLMDLFTAKPIDALKPMWIDGKQYKNAVISNDKSKIETKHFKVAEKTNITKTIVIEKNKTTTKTNHDYLYLGMFLIVVIAVWSWFYFRKGI